MNINNFFNTYPKIKYLFYFAGTLVVGGLGSGVWEYILKPLFSNGVDFILDLSTLGIETFKNSVYEEISQGFSEKNSIKIYNLFITLLMGSFVIFFLLMFDRIKAIKEKLILTENTKEKKEKKNIELEVSNIEIKLRIFIFLTSCFFLILLIYTKKLDYINNSIIYYTKLKDITSPYVSDLELKKITSNFAQIKNKNDYVSLINKLHSISEENNLKINKEYIW